MNTTKCPKLGCEKYISGRECSSCGTVPHEEEIVICKECHERVLEDDCETYTVQDDITGKYSKKHICYDCK